MDIKKFYDFVKDKPFYAFTMAGGEKPYIGSIEVSDNIGTLFYVGELIDNTGWDQISRVDSVNVYWFEEEGGRKSSTTPYQLGKVMLLFDTSDWVLKDLYQTGVKIKDAVEYLSGIDTSLFFESENFIHKPKLNIRFDPALIDKNELKPYLDAIMEEYPGIEWYGGGSIYEFNPISDDNEVSDYNGLTELTVGYFKERPDALTYSTNYANEWPTVDADEWMELRKIDTNDMFNQLYESEENDLEWAQDAINNTSLEVDYQNIIDGAKVVRGKDWGFGNQDEGSVYGILITKGVSEYDDENLYSEMREERGIEYEQWWCRVNWINSRGHVIHSNQYRVGSRYHDLNYYVGDKLHESEENDDFDWIDNGPYVNPLLKIGANFLINEKNLGSPQKLLVRVIDIEFNEDSQSYDIVFKAFNDEKKYKWNDHTENVGLAWANELVNPETQNHWIPISDEDVSKLLSKGRKRLKEDDSKDMENLIGTVITFDDNITTADVDRVNDYIKNLGFNGLSDDSIEDIYMEATDQGLSYIRLDNSKKTWWGSYDMFLSNHQNNPKTIDYKDFLDIFNTTFLDNLNESEDVSDDYEPQVGDYLYCHTDLIMNDDDSVEATKGKTYKITDVNPREIYIKNNTGYEHSFTRNGNESEYRNWFHIVPKAIDVEGIFNKDFFGDLYESEDLEWAQDLFKQSTELTPIDVDNLKVGMKIVVGGGKNRGLNSKVGTVIDSGEQYNHISRKTTNFKLISFDNWYGGYDDSTPRKDHWSKPNPLCKKHNCWYFTKYNIDNGITFYTNKFLNESEEDDSLEWARDVVSTSPLIGNAWHINLGRDKNEFIEIQEWLFNQGFSWAGGGTKLKTNRKNVRSVQSIFRDDIENHSFTYNDDKKTTKKDDIKSSVRIAGNNSDKGFLLAFNWPKLKPKIIKTNVDEINESEDDGLEWAREVLSEPAKALVIGQDYKVKHNRTIDSDNPKGYNLHIRPYGINNEYVSYLVDNDSTHRGTHERYRGVRVKSVSKKHGEHLVDSGYWVPIPREESIINK